MMLPPSYLPPSFSGLIGVSREDITPPAGIYARNWGAAEQDVAEGVHRPLTLTCLTFQIARHAKPLVLAAADLGWWKSRTDEEFVRSGVIETLSLPEAQVMLCLSHTHSGPSLDRDDVNKLGGQHIEAYLQRLREAIIAAARTAMAGATPAVLNWRYGKCDLATNRDLDEPGGGRCLVGFNPSSPADDTLLVGRVTGDDGRMIATVVNYACHPTTLAWANPLISPDYVGAMREVVENQTRAPCLFLQGASGELAPAEQYSGEPAPAEAHGRRLGWAVLSTLEAMLPPATRLVFEGVVESGTALGIWKRERELPSPLLSARAVEIEMVLKPMPSLAEIEDHWRRTEDRVLKERLWRQRGIRRIVGEGSTAKLRLWCWRLGDALLFGQPCEAYSHFQLALRQRFGPRAVVVMNIVNGYAGYLPARENYNRQPYPVAVTPYQAGACEQMTEQAIQAGQAALGESG